MLRKLFARDAGNPDNLKYRRSEIVVNFHTDKLILCSG